MKRRLLCHISWVFLIGTFILQACGVSPSVATAIVSVTDAPKPSEPTITKVPTTAPVASLTSVQLSGLMPTRTPNLAATKNAEAWKTSQVGQTPMPRATRTPNLAATQQMDQWNTEAQSYFEAGYLTTSEGKLVRLDDFSEEWAQLGWYWSWPLTITAEDFFMSGHLKWTSAYRSADISGCGFVFAEQKNGDHYAVFLDRSKVLFVETEEYYFPIGTTRGSGRVDFGNPFDEPVEADLTLIVKSTYAYVLVNGKVVGEYTLAQSKNLRGTLGLALLSGTNKDFGTRCEITNLHAWLPNE